MKSVLQGIDVRNPTQASVEAVTLQNAEPAKLVERLRPLYPRASFTVASKRSLLIRADAVDLAQAKSIIQTLDVAPLTPSPGASAVEALRVSQRRPADIAHAVARQMPKLRVAVSGASIVVSGSVDDVAHAKSLVAQLDLPSFGDRYLQVYRIHTLDATSVAALIMKSFPDAHVDVDRTINAFSVTASATEQRRIADAVAQLDATLAIAPGGANVPPSLSAGGDVAVVTLRSAVPQAAGAPTADGNASITQALQQVVPDVHVVNLPTAGQIALIGNPEALRLAKEFLSKADVPAPLVVLDTEILEMDESVARNLGLQFTQPLLSTSFSEMSPVSTDGGIPRLIGFQPLTRTALSLGVQLNLLIQKGNARVLADPRITTLSGRTATIHAGDSIGILTTTGGGVGTATTTQLQTFQTGVNLDITPLVAGDDVTVSLHPVVNSLSGILNGVPQISTRDAQTTVHLRNDQTLVIGGLIQESVTRTEQKIPIVGDLPGVGHLFRNQQVSSTRNELVIVVTPHILYNGATAPPASPALPQVPTPRALPTLPPNTVIPSTKEVSTHRKQAIDLTEVKPPRATSEVAPFCWTGIGVS